MSCLWSNTFVYTRQFMIELLQMITIKKAIIKDFKIIQDFNNKLCVKENREFDSTVNPNFATSEGGQRYFKNSIESNDKLVLIAKDNDIPIGYLVGGIEPVGDFRTIPNMCEVDNMWVDEIYRSQGVGKKLMDKLQIWAKDKGIKRIRVIASYQNKKGINFYKRGDLVNMT